MELVRKEFARNVEKLVGNNEKVVVTMDSNNIDHQIVKIKMSVHMK